MKRASRIPQDSARKRLERQRRLLRDAGEQLEIDDAELEEIDAELARRTLELES